jgi:hypothetical protein
VEILMTLMNIPFVSNRIFIDAKYLRAYPERDEYIAIISNQGNEKIQEDYLIRSKTPSNVVVGKTTLSAHWFRPLYDEGTN